MLVTDTTRVQLKHGRIRWQLLQDGYEQIVEGSDLLGELCRGPRWRHRIVDAVVDPAGKSVWVRIIAPEQSERSDES